MNLQKKKKAIMNAVQSGGGRLPAEFQEVEWIESDQTNGTVYIELNYSPIVTDKIFYKITNSVKRSWPQGTPMGVIGNNTNNRFIVAAVDNRTEYFGIFNGVGAKTYNFEDVYDVPYEAEIHNNLIVITVDGVETLISYGTLGTTTDNFNLCLFTRNISGVPSTSTNYLADRKMYYFTAYDSNDNAIIDLVPCYRKSNNEIGLYDLVNSYFYTNDGTGTFSKGPDV